MRRPSLSRSSRRSAFQEAQRKLSSTNVGRDSVLDPLAPTPFGTDVNLISQVQERAPCNLSQIVDAEDVESQKHVEKEDVQVISPGRLGKSVNEEFINEIIESASSVEKPEMA